LRYISTFSLLRSWLSISAFSPPYQTSCINQSILNLGTGFIRRSKSPTSCLNRDCKINIFMLHIPTARMFNFFNSIFHKDDSRTYTPLPTSSPREKPSGNALFTTSSTTSDWQPSPRTISDATLGLSDGLTVPFALTAGLAALGNTKLVVFAGLAELMAGAISMGLGGYLGASGEA